MDEDIAGDQIPEIGAKHQVISREIKRVAMGQSLASIHEHLADGNGWYKDISKNPGLTLGCWLHAFEQTQKYAKKEPVSDEINAILIDIAEIYNKGLALEKQGVFALSGIKESMSADLLRVGTLLEQLTKWCGSQERTKDDIALVKTFLIVGNTLSQRFRSMSSFEKKFFNDTQLESIQAKLEALDEAATTSISTLVPSEAVKTLEQQLSTDLAKRHQVIFSVDSKIEKNKKFTEIKHQLTQQSSDLNELHALRYLQDLFKQNNAKTTGREYFTDLIGGSQERINCFATVLEKSSEREKDEWTKRSDNARKGSIYTKSAFVVSTLLAPGIAAGRVMSSFVPSYVLNCVSSLDIGSVFDTADSKNKVDFSALIEQRIDSACARIASAGNEVDNELKDGLKKAEPEKIEELKIKTDLLVQLYEIDARLTEFIERNNTRTVRFGNWLSEYIHYQGPVGALITRAKTYQDKISQLKEAVLSEKSVNQACITAIDKVEALESKQATYKTFFDRLRAVKSVETLAIEEENDNQSSVTPTDRTGSV